MTPSIDLAAVRKLADGQALRRVVSGIIEVDPPCANTIDEVRMALRSMADEIEALRAAAFAARQLLLIKGVGASIEDAADDLRKKLDLVQEPDE